MSYTKKIKAEIFSDDVIALQILRKVNKVLQSETKGSYQQRFPEAFSPNFFHKSDQI